MKIINKYRNIFLLSLLFYLIFYVLITSSNNSKSFYINFNNFDIKNSILELINLFNFEFKYAIKLLLIEIVFPIPVIIIFKIIDLNIKKIIKYTFFVIIFKEFLQFSFGGTLDILDIFINTLSLLIFSTLIYVKYKLGKKV